MNISEIPLSPDNQQFAVTISGASYRIRIIWRDPSWYMDFLNYDGTALALSVPLITGNDLLEPYSYLGFGFKLFIVCDLPEMNNPTKTDLGINSHLYVVTE